LQSQGVSFRTSKENGLSVATNHEHAMTWVNSVLGKSTQFG
jgi:hypothetical protein